MMEPYNWVKVPTQEDTAYKGQYAPQSVKDLSRRSEKTGTISQVNWTLWLITGTWSWSLRVPLGGWWQHQRSSLLIHCEPAMTSKPLVGLFYWPQHLHEDSKGCSLGNVMNYYINHWYHVRTMYTNVFEA